MMSLHVAKTNDVFPASAGVILDDYMLARKTCSFPRIRGGDPRESLNYATRDMFSPHPRG